MSPTPMWKCRKCGRLFANRNQSHFCSSYTLREHLTGKSPSAVALFRQFAKLVKRCGPVRVVPEKTRIAFQVRMSLLQ
jgi:transposase-like protein